MFLHEESDQWRFPVFEPDFTSTDIEELLAFFQNDEPEGSNSASWSNKVVHLSIDERKRRRMISNRESARRSRLKKKRNLENLTNQVNRLKVENREYKNRLGLVMNQNQLIRRENDRLRTEAVALWTRLSDLYQIMLAMQLQ